MPSYDGVVIGAGHNGLTLAAYMARAGMKVAVLERNARIGGGTSTEEPTLPGYRFNLHSNFFMGFRHSPLIRDLDLHRFGFSYIEPLVQQGAAFRDGTCVVIHKDLDKTCASLARFSKRDAETFRDLHNTYSIGMRPLFTSLAFNAPLPIDQLKDRLSGPQAKEFCHTSSTTCSVWSASILKTTAFARCSRRTCTSSPPKAYRARASFPLIFANVMEFTLPVGGAVTFPLALQRLIEAHGGAVMTGADVKEIVVKNGRAAAVRLANGDTIEGKRFVASAIDAPATMRMAGEELFPEDVRKKLNSWHWGNHSLVTLHLALRHAPIYRSQNFDPDIARAYNIFFGMDDIDQVASCFDDCAKEKFPDVLMGNGACNSAVDPTYAPADGHSAFWWPFAPYAIGGDPKEWDRGKAEYTERVLSVWREYASNLGDDNVRAKFLFTPLDVERLNVNMVKGAVRMGAYIPSQLGINRPHPLLSGTRTTIEGLYLCGSSTGNGGGINGAPGYIAANAIADDFKLERPWSRVPQPEWRH